MWSCLCSVGALAPASSLGAQGVSHPVHSFVEPFTCVMQERAGGGGFAAEGWRGARAAGPCAARQRTRQSGTGATTLEAPTARAQHDGLPERCGVGWGGHAGAVTAVSFRRRTRNGGAGLDLPRLLLERVELRG